MRLERDSSAGVEVLRLSGELDAASYPEVGGLIDELIAGGADRIVIGVGGVTFIHSAGLGYLIRTSQQLRASGGGLVLAGPGELLRGKLATLGIDRIVPVMDTEAEAVDSLRNPA